jgi:hypothetical protein
MGIRPTFSPATILPVISAESADEVCARSSIMPGQPP